MEQSNSGNPCLNISHPWLNHVASIIPPHWNGFNYLQRKLVTSTRDQQMLKAHFVKNTICGYQLIALLRNLLLILKSKKLRGFTGKFLVQKVKTWKCSSIKWQNSLQMLDKWVHNYISFNRKHVQANTMKSDLHVLIYINVERQITHFQIQWSGLHLSKYHDFSRCTFLKSHIIFETK